MKTQKASQLWVVKHRCKDGSWSVGVPVPVETAITMINELRAKWPKEEIKMERLK
jgi:hypothetical protein